MFIWFFVFFFFFFFNDTATTEIYTLSLHDALPISHGAGPPGIRRGSVPDRAGRRPGRRQPGRERHRHSHRDEPVRSEEHTSELQSRSDLVCRLLLEKKKKKHSRESPTNNKTISI